MLTDSEDGQTPSLYCSSFHGHRRVTRITALLCWEFGFGRGQLKRLAALSQMFQALGVRTVLAYPSQFKGSAERWRDRFDVIVPVPPSTGLGADVPTRHRVRSFGDALVSFGMADVKRVIARIRLR